MTSNTTINVAKRKAYFPLPEGSPVSRFITDFDQGKYPELVDLFPKEV